MKDGDTTDVGTTLGRVFEGSAKRIVTVDVERYQHFLDNSGMSPEEKRAFLEALWSVITAFVDLGFGVHPVQQACGQLEDSAGSRADGGVDGVDCGQADLSRTFNDAPKTE